MSPKLIPIFDQKIIAGISIFFGTFFSTIKDIVPKKGNHTIIFIAILNIFLNSTIYHHSQNFNDDINSILRGQFLVGIYRFLNYFLKF